MLFPFDLSPAATESLNPYSLQPPACSGQSLGPERAGYLPIKGALDLLLALVLLVLAAPVIGLTALLVKLTSRGPALYSQTRVGRYGRPYAIYKIRTMYHQCEQRTGPCWAVPKDPRVTPLGRFLRWAHIDELPQLWNVLRGDMSLVGPRPERPEFFPHLEKHVPFYRERLAVRPGVTGLAQVQRPADTDVESVRKKLAYDLYYVQNMSLYLDLRILLSTALKVLGVSFPVLRKVFLMPSREEVERTYQSLPAVGQVLPQMQPTL
jgi:lipopolysaccharide/colanic/teichoic acid biosynthesis glycosyltransferase